MTWNKRTIIIIIIILYYTSEVVKNLSQLMLIDEMWADQLSSTPGPNIYISIQDRILMLFNWNRQFPLKYYSHLQCRNRNESRVSIGYILLDWILDIIYHDMFFTTSYHFCYNTLFCPFTNPDLEIPAVKTVPNTRIPS